MSVPGGQRRLLVYDGECPLCRRAAKWLEQSDLAPGADCVAWQDLTAEPARRAREAGFHNEMAVLEPDGTVHTGAHGLFVALADGPLGAFARFADRPLVRPLADLVYRTVAYNRRVLAPPPTPGLVCACDPDEHRGFQWVLIVVLVGFAAGSGWLLGSALVERLGLDPAALPWLVVAAAVGWLPPALAGLALAPDRRMRWWGHLAIAAAAGALVLLPAAAALPWLSRDAASAVAVATAVLAIVWAWRALRRRIELMGLGPGWVVGATTSVLAGGAWAVLLAAGSIRP